MIYVVEDDASIRELVVYTLQSTGFEVNGFDNGNDFLTAVKVKIPELVLLDIMLPGQDGISLLKLLRASSTTKKLPVIMVTAKGTEYDKVIGLDSGADDYVSKPFGMMELVSRIKALLRRTKSQDDEKGKVYSVGNLSLDTKKHIVKADGAEILLTFKEFELLYMLMKNEENVLTREQILSSIWNYEFDGETRTVDVHVRTLRQKLGECGNMIETVRGVGYRIGGNR
ncbi:MAG TPA: response regulator transcription factor [Oscillospiraceae bacterium]|nr:response regulator transcription factor [Oscillospiraceae bacterium]